MSEGVLELEDVEDFFEEGFVVDAHTEALWSFLATSDEFDGYTVTLEGSGFPVDGDFPATGTVGRIVVANADGTVADISGLSLPVADLLDEIDFDDGEDDDDDGSEDGDDIYSGDGDDDLHGGGGDDHIYSGDGDDDIKGDDGNDFEDGGDGDDDLFGNGGDDDLIGGVGDDSIHGGGGKDTAEGREGRDDIFGQGGSDDLDGNSGKDDLIGAGGDDDLDGGSGDDHLNGGGGDDDFIFDDGFGDDVIAKFVAKHDRIDLGGTGLTFSDLAIDKSGGNTVIMCDQGTITIDKLVGNLHESDFVF